jgi:hypothetical protein
MLLVAQGASWLATEDAVTDMAECVQQRGTDFFDR